MDPLEPIAGISLERYAELCAKMSNCGTDPETFVRIAGENGVDRGTWEAAMNGWNARMWDPATAGAVAMAYHPLYQDALKKYAAPPPEIPLEQYATMYATVMKKSEPEMFAEFSVTAVQWSQISTEWVGKLSADGELRKRFTDLAQSEMERIGAGV